jgi:hypothetical protein
MITLQDDIPRHLKTCFDTEPSHTFEGTEGGERTDTYKVFATKPYLITSAAVSVTHKPVDEHGQLEAMIHTRIYSGARCVGHTIASFYGPSEQAVLEVRDQSQLVADAVHTANSAYATESRNGKAPDKKLLPLQPLEIVDWIRHPKFWEEVK